MEGEIAEREVTTEKEEKEREGEKMGAGRATIPGERGSKEGVCVRVCGTDSCEASCFLSPSAPCRPHSSLLGRSRAHCMAAIAATAMAASAVSVEAGAAAALRLRVQMPCIVNR